MIGFRRALVATLCWLAGCTETIVDTTVTGVELTVTHERELEIDQLEITGVSETGEPEIERSIVPDQPRLLDESGETAVILVPSELAGIAIDIDVFGLRQGVRVAVGQASVSLIAEQLVFASLHLADNCPGQDNPGQADHEGDGDGDACDGDDDNDGVADAQDRDPLDPTLCSDVDADSCDDCSQIADGFGAGSNQDPGDDGGDADGDGLCDDGDPDIDGDGVLNGSDGCPIGEISWISDAVTDHDADGCRDVGEDGDDDGDSVGDAADSCAQGVTGWVSTVANDFDGDGCFDSGEDNDNDNDGVNDTPDPENENPMVCGDSDADTCDDCSIGVDGIGPSPDATPGNDGPDSDGDGICDAGDS